MVGMYSGSEQQKLERQPLPQSAMRQERAPSLNDTHKGTHHLLEHVEAISTYIEEPFHHDKPQRKLVFIDGVAILVGIMIGSGIFSSPGLALEKAGSPGLSLVIWAMAGGLVMMASFCYAELGSIIPSSGGDYDYLQRAYGDQAAFSFAWFNFFVGKTGSQAIIATIFGRYFDAVLSGDTSSISNGSVSAEETTYAKICGVCLILFITGINCAGIKESAVLSIVLTSTKVLLIVAVFVFSVVYACSSYSHSEDIRENLSPSSAFEGSKGFFSLGSAMVACLWCFDGYADANFLMEELVNPIADLPRIIGLGVTIVTLCYISINVAYLSVLSKDDIINSEAIAVDFGSTASHLWDTGRNVFPIILALGVSLSTVGSINGSIMTGGRAFYAVSRHGQAPSIGASLNRYGAPWAALLAQGTWSLILLLIPGSNFATLLDYFGPCSWAFYASTASALIVLRRREPDLPRPFRVPLYPLPPLIVIVMAVSIIVSSLSSQPLFTLLAFAFVLASFPVYQLMRRHGCVTSVAKGSTAGHRSLNEVFTIEDDDSMSGRLQGYQYGDSTHHPLRGGV